MLNANWSTHTDPVAGSYDFAIGHQGLMHDPTGLVYNRARMLHPLLGRFTQRDPLGYVDGMSLYAGYHLMSWGLDPSGMYSTAEWIDVMDAFLSGAGYGARNWASKMWGVVVGLGETAALVTSTAEAEFRAMYDDDWIEARDAHRAQWVEMGRNLKRMPRDYYERITHAVATGDLEELGDISADISVAAFSAAAGAGAARYMKMPKSRGANKNVASPSVRDRVLANIAESKRARQASNFSEYVERLNRRPFIRQMDPDTAKAYKQYWKGYQQYPTQRAPYQIKTWHHPDGTIKTVQTYDELGHAHRQYGLRERNHPPHQHDYRPRITRNGNAPYRDPPHKPIDE